MGALPQADLWDTPGTASGLALRHAFAEPRFALKLGLHAGGMFYGQTVTADPTWETTAAALDRDLGTVPGVGQLVIEYVPGESNSLMFGGNSNWRDPIWLP